MHTFCNFNCALFSHPNQDQLVAWKRWLVQVTVHMKCILSDFSPCSFLIYNACAMKSVKFSPTAHLNVQSSFFNVYNILWLCNRHYVRRNLYLEPTTIPIDFEVAIHTVGREAIPSATIKCCRFHLGQTWWRKIHTIGLGAHYKDNQSEIRKWLKCVLVCTPNMWAGIPSEEKKTMTQNCFMLTLTDSSTHLIQPFYIQQVVSSCYVFQLPY